MLRYYSYYSVGGYKDFFLGSNADLFEASYYLPLLPVWEKRAQEKADLALQKKVDELKKQPSIKVMDEKQSFGMPKAGNALFSHGGYKLIYRHLEGDIFALAVRDIPSSSKDESGREIPFLFIITSDNPEDTHKLNMLAAYAATNMTTFSNVISSMLGYDVEKNGLRFDIAALNIWIDKVTKTHKSEEIPTMEKELDISARKGAVSLLLIPDGVPSQTAISEQGLTGNNIMLVHTSDVLPLDNPQKLISILRNHYEKQFQDREKAMSEKRLKELLIAASGGAILGAMLGVTIAKLFN